MSAAGESSRSIAVELALLFLRELEPRGRRGSGTAGLDRGGTLLCGGQTRGSDHVATLVQDSREIRKSGPDRAHARRSVALGSRRRRVRCGQTDIGLVLESGIEFFHDPDQHGWASIRVDGHWENHPIRSRPFQLFLLRTYYQETGNSPGAQAIRATLELFEAKALFDGEESIINLRVANHRGKLYLDLCDRAWRASRSIPKDGE